MDISGVLKMDNDFVVKDNLKEEKKEVKKVELGPTSTETQEQETTKPIDQPIPLNEEIISKAAAAIEVRKEAIQAFIAAVSGIFLIMLTAVMSNINIIYGVAVGGVSAAAFGYLAFRAFMKVKTLNKTYKLK
jgi:hypothetical protein